MAGQLGDNDFMSDAAALLRAYDQQLRGAVELDGAIETDQDGPLHIGLFEGGWGFVSYVELTGYTEPHQGELLDQLIARTVHRFAEDPRATAFEWKTRGHDLPADLPDRLAAQGLVPDELETIMAGEAAALTSAPTIPSEVTLRRVGFGSAGTRESLEKTTLDVTAAIAMQDEVFGRPGNQSPAAFARDIFAKADQMQFWIAEVAGEVISAGRLVIVPGTDFAGLWGGATREQWRGRGIYRALTAARAKAAVAAGVRYMQVDCSPMSRLILERSGLVAITTSTPFRWNRNP